MTNQSPTLLSAGVSRMDFHGGSSLMLSAKLYPTLLAATLEIVQNAVDSDPKNIWMKLNRQKRSLDVYDDGVGTSWDEFNEALRKRGQSSKKSDKLGRFGRGLVSPIDKCEVMTFTSCPRASNNAYMQWTFRASELAPNPEPHIPYEQQPQIQFGKANKTLTIDSKTVSQVTWRTKISLRNYSTDREIGKIGSIDDLAKEIFSRYGAVMRAKKIRLHIEFTNEAGKTEAKTDMFPPEYTGQRLPEYIANIRGIRTTFRLFLAKAEGRMGKSNGTVVVGEANNPFRFAFKLLVNNCGEYLSADVAKALKSGIFEGEIIAAGATLHENRKQFNINDGLTNFAAALEQWYLEIGAHHMEEIQETQEGERYQKLGLASMENIAAMLKTPRFSHLAELFRYMKHGTVGKQHSDAERIVGQQENPSQSVQKGGGTKGPHSEAGEKQPTEPPKTLEDHHPHTVVGPKGQRRNVVEGGSFGLQFSYEKMPGEERLWIFDDAQGILRFNVRHPTWAMCDTSNIRIMQLQELVAVQAINWFFEPDNATKNALLRLLEAAIDQIAFMLVHNASFNSGAPKKIKEE